MLQTIERRFLKSDIAIAIGDRNATVSSDNTLLGHVMWIQGLGDLHHNGARSVDFCSFYRLASNKLNSPTSYDQLDQTRFAVD